MANLTKRSIDAFRYRGGWDVRWDAAVPGFGVRVYPSGKKAFVLSYRARGRKRFMVLGRYGADLTLDQARTRARKERVKVGENRDPLEEKRAAGRGRTFGDLVDDFMEKHVQANRLKTEKATRRRLDRNIPAAWKRRTADAIETWEIEDLHKKIGASRPYEANRFLSILRTMYRHAPLWKYLPKDAPNPTKGIEKFKEKKRKRWVTKEEVPPLVRAIDEEPNVYVRGALWLYLLTGLRKSELLTAKRADIDWNRAQLRLPDTKSGEEQVAALNEPAMMILRALPRLSRNPYILPGAKEGAHLVNIDKPWRRVRARATVRQWAECAEPEVVEVIGRLRDDFGRQPTYGECVEAARSRRVDLPSEVVDVRLHDLRRTVGSWLSQSAVDLNTIKEALRHASISTTLIYARLGADPAREALEVHGRQVMEIAGRPRLVEGGSGNE